MPFAERIILRFSIFTAVSLVVLLTTLGVAQAIPKNTFDFPEYHPTTAQSQVELENLFVTIENHYGPLAMKKQSIGLDWENTKRTYRERLSKTTSAKDFYFLVTDLLSGFNDAHVSISLPSTLVKELPLQFSYVESKMIVNFIGGESAKDSEGSENLALGDELLNINGTSWQQVMASQPAFNKNGNTLTNRALFARQLTSLNEARGVRLLSTADEKVKFTLKRAKDGTSYTVTMKYKTKGQALLDRQVAKLQFTSFLGFSPGEKRAEAALAANKDSRLPKFLSTTERARIRSVEKVINAIHKTFNTSVELPVTAPASEPATTPGTAPAKPDQGTRVEIGHRVPLFQMPADFKEIRFPLLGMFFNADSFYAGVFQHNGKRVGFLRIPSYGPSNVYTMLYALRYYIHELGKRSDYLIVDQMNNPGGMVAYCDFIVRALVGHYDEKNHMRFLMKPSQGFLQMYASMVETMEGEESTLPAPLKAKFLGAFKAEYAKLRTAYERGDSMTEPASLLIVSEFMEAMFDHLVEDMPILRAVGWLTSSEIFKVQNYTKPVYFVTNELDFSGGDYTPATLQDYGRVRLLGVRTAGAGGTVEALDHRGTIEFTYHLTTSLMYRKGGALVENYGVKPDQPFELTVEDYRTGFKETLTRLLKTIESGGGTAPRMP